MPMMGAQPGGQLPPSMTPAPAHVGPGVMPSGNQGNAASAMVDIQNAIHMLEKALPMVPMGEPLHSEILGAVKSLSKHIPEGAGNQGLQMQSLLQLIKSQQQKQPLSALSRMYPGAGPNTPPATNQPPAPPPPPGAAGAEA